MKKIVVAKPGGFDNLKVIEVADPTPKHGEVLVRWRATSLNYHDLLVANGSIPVEENRAPMSDGAGEIVALGEGVSGWRIGDKVMSLFFPKWADGQATAAKTGSISGETSDGFAQEMSCVSHDSITHMPQGFSFSEAATLPCAALTAWRGLVVAGQIKAGDKVLIQGSGGMSLFGLQFAKRFGAYVYATTSSEEKAHKLMEMGADKVINYTEDERWGRTVLKDSGGVDHVLDVGGPVTLEHSVEAVGFGGKITLIGILGGTKGAFILPKLFFKHASMHGIAVGSRTMQEDMVRALNVDPIKPVIDRTFAFDELADAFRYQQSGAHFGKIVVEI